jgi:hypothetical protein
MGQPPADCEDCTTSNCALCFNDKNSCENCQQGFEMTSSGECASIIGKTLPSSGECPDLPLCQKCSDGSHCDECIDAGTYVLNNEGTGCEDCYVVSGQTCSKCSKLSRCDVCERTKQGPVIPTTTATCGDCASNCQFCSINGAGKCDDNGCDAGYALDSEQNCSPCAPGCQLCTSSGPGSCDETL